jgi:large subunit ribosomal protein L30
MKRPPRSLRSLPPEGAHMSLGTARPDMAEPKMIKVTLAKGIARARGDHRATVRGLGLKWTRHTVEVIDTPETRGMIDQVRYLVKVVD